MAEITINCSNNSNGGISTNKAFFLKKIASDKERAAERL
jgi:hypothetical protein